MLAGKALESLPTFREAFNVHYFEFPAAGSGEGGVIVDMIGQARQADPFMTMFAGDPSPAPLTAEELYQIHGFRFLYSKKTDPLGGSRTVADAEWLSDAAEAAPIFERWRTIVTDKNGTWLQSAVANDSP
jgi:hypothetical protein